MSMKSVMPFNHLILCHPFLLLPSIFPSIRVFSNESVLCIRWPKYWNFSFRIHHMNIQNWFPLGLTGWISLQSKRLSSLLQQAAILLCSAFFIVRLYSLLSKTFIENKSPREWPQITTVFPSTVPWLHPDPCSLTERLRGWKIRSYLCCLVKWKYYFPILALILVDFLCIKLCFFSTHRRLENLKKCSQGNNWLNLVEDTGCRWIPI